MQIEAFRSYGWGRGCVVSILPTCSYSQARSTVSNCYHAICMDGYAVCVHIQRLIITNESVSLPPVNLTF